VKLTPGCLLVDRDVIFISYLAILDIKIRTEEMT
jgi:hypothetical protein